MAAKKGLLEVGNEPEVWIQVHGYEGFDVLIKYVTPQNIRSLNDQATSKTLNRQTRAMEDTVDQDLLGKLMVEEMVQNWRGLTIEHLEKMMPLSAESKKAIKAAGGELPFTPVDLKTLTDYAYSKDFMDVVMELATDLEALREAEEVQRSKNSDG